MGLSKTEINLKRLLAAAPQQQNKVKLVHYIATLREQLEQLSTERTLEGLPRVSKAAVNDYSKKIEAIAAKLASPVVAYKLPDFEMVCASMEIDKKMSSKSDIVAFPKLTIETSFNDVTMKKEEENSTLSPGLRRRLVPSSAEHRGHDSFESSDSSPVKLDAAAQAHITKHRKLQEDLTDEMVDLARQLKERSLMMNTSIQNTERILDSTEKAVEHSLASTGRANTQAVAVNSESFKTSCFTWLVMLVMSCIFVMVLLLIKMT